MNIIRTRSPLILRQKPLRTFRPWGAADETYFFTISLTVTDGAGLSTTKTVTLSPDCSSIVKITPLITWPEPAAIIVGTPLSATQLNAEASHNGFAIPGTFTYTPAAETILPVGNSQELAVTFTPTSTALYNSASKIVTIHVNAVPKITPVINWANPSAIAVGTPLGSTQLNATATHNGSPVAGTFAYTPDAGTILNVGAEQDLSVTFTPTNTTVYNPVNKTVKIDVNKTFPLITWSNPAPIGVGTALGAVQLNAVASYNGSPVPGTFAYTPPAGTLLSLGTGQQLSVSFTPNDDAVYLPATKTVAIDVLESLPTTFYRALNLNGAALTIDGNSWQSSIGAANFSFTQNGGGSFSAQNIPLIPTYGYQPCYDDTFLHMGQYGEFKCNSCSQWQLSCICICLGRQFHPSLLNIAWRAQLCCQSTTVALAEHGVNSDHSGQYYGRSDQCISQWRTCLFFWYRSLDSRSTAAQPAAGCC